MIAPMVTFVTLAHTIASPHPSERQESARRTVIYDDAFPTMRLEAIRNCYSDANTIARPHAERQDNRSSDNASPILSISRRIAEGIHHLLFARAVALMNIRLSEAMAGLDFRSAGSVT
jgi:hypothetical protein